MIPIIVSFNKFTLMHIAIFHMEDGLEYVKENKMSLGKISSYNHYHVDGQFIVIRVKENQFKPTPK